MMIRDDIVVAINEELGRAVRRFPEWPEDLIHCAAIVGEEAGELMRAALQYTYQDGRRMCMREEALHTAAMAIRFLQREF